MSQTSPTPNQRMVTELKVSANLMLLDPGLFCVFHSPGAAPPDPQTGLPGVRITRPPTSAPESLAISTFNPDGWLGGEGNAALVRVTGGPSQILVTIYQALNSTAEAPKLQVLRLSEAAAARPVQEAPVEPKRVENATPTQAGAATTPAEKPEVAAHVQRRGDLLTRLGDWMGTRGSQNWIEGFAIAPSRFVDPADIEYQAVLGKGWLSPWAEGGTYCGSRGMALPILGLRVRLKGDAAERHDIRLSATFTDGTSVGPVDSTETAEASSLAPLEAFLIEIVPLEAASTASRLPAAAKPTRSAPRAEPARPAPRVEAPRAAPAKVVKAPVKARAQPAPIPPARAPARPAPRAPVSKSGNKGRR